MSWYYLIVLLLSLIGLGFADWRWRLALFKDYKTTLMCLGIGLGFFLAWDILGIQSGIFFVGDSLYTTGVRILPEVPIEEILFLILLNYTALLTWQKLAK